MIILKYMTSCIFYLKDLIELINLSFSLKERLLKHHLCKDTAHWPHVHRCGILLNNNTTLKLLLYFSPSNNIIIHIKLTGAPSRSSGDLYHSVTTIGVYFLKGEPYSRAKPKSATCRSHTRHKKCRLGIIIILLLQESMQTLSMAWWLTSKLEAFKSLWMIQLSWRWCTALSSWIIRVLTSPTSHQHKNNNSWTTHTKCAAAYASVLTLKEWLLHRLH